jgi:nitrate reductase NapD
MNAEFNPARRAVLKLGAADPSGKQSSGDIYIAGLVIRARPERLSSVRAALTRLPGAEIHAVDERGKLVLTLEAATDGRIADLMLHIPDIPGVLTCDLAHYHSEAAAQTPGDEPT